MAIPRGIRNNNPLNIRESKSDGTHWLGERATDDDPAFEEFSHMRFGIRAAARILLGYQDRHGLRTIRGIVHRWAPPSENDSTAYMDIVARSTGFGADAQIDLRDRNTMMALIVAMARVENGDDYLLPDDVLAGVALALPETA